MDATLEKLNRNCDRIAVNATFTNTISLAAAEAIGAGMPLADVCRSMIDRLHGLLLTHASEQRQEVGDMLDGLRVTLDLKEAVGELDKLLGEHRAACEKRLVGEHERSGLDRLGNEALTVTFDSSALRVKYDPALWGAIVKWAASTGNDHIVQRRLTDGKVIELANEGVALPEGLSLESYTKVSIRRK